MLRHQSQYWISGSNRKMTRTIRLSGGAGQSELTLIASVSSLQPHQNLQRIALIIRDDSVVTHGDRSEEQICLGTSSPPNAPAAGVRTHLREKTALQLANAHGRPDQRRSMPGVFTARTARPPSPTLTPENRRSEALYQKRNYNPAQNTTRLQRSIPHHRVPLE